MSSRAVIFLGATVRRSIFTILNSTTSSLSQTCQAHAQILKSGLLNDTSLSTKIVSFYANCESFTDATRILDTLPQPDLPSFSVLIYALSKFNLPTLVLRVFAEMLSRGVSPDSHVLPAVAKACALLGHSKIGKAVHGIVSVSGFALDEVVQSSLLHMYLKCDEIFLARKMFDQMCEPNLVTLSALVSGYARKGCSDEARGLFYEMSSLGLEPNLVSWNGMISGFNQSGLYREAVNMFRELHVQGLHPDESSISSALSALGDLENISLGSQIHGYVIKEGLISDKWVSSALIDMYNMLQVFDEVGCLETGSSSALIAGLSRNGLVDNALSMIKRIRKQGIELSVISWTSMIACCSQNGKDIEALDLFRDMQLKGVKPNSVTIPCLLPACGNIAALFHGKSVHCFSLRSGIIDVYVGSALVDIQKGLTDEGWYFFNSMCKEHGIEAKAEHYACMVNLLSRAGRLEEAYSIIKGDKSLPQVPQILEKLDVWNIEMKTLGLAPKTDFVLQDVEEQDKELILCGHSEKYSRSQSPRRDRSRSLSRPRDDEVRNPGNTLFVTGLSSRVTERDLKDHFGKEGKVSSVFLVVEPRTQISRGFAFVTMSSLEDADRCIKYLNQSVLEGRYITVEKAFVVTVVEAVVAMDGMTTNTGDLQGDHRRHIVEAVAIRLDVLLPTLGQGGRDQDHTLLMIAVMGAALAFLVRVLLSSGTLGQFLVAFRL
ncbi:hypothetical protein V2J09_017207 [Rumex salicifolius]